MSEWNEDKYKGADEYQAFISHDCWVDWENCNSIHPTYCKTNYAVLKDSLPENIPQHHRHWMMYPHVIIRYLDKMTLRHEYFNISEAFFQMSGGGKINVMELMYRNLLNDDEQSLFLSQIVGDRVKASGV